MPDVNGINGHHEPGFKRTEPTSYFYGESTSNGAPQSVNGSDVPPAEAYNDVEYMRNITVPLNNVPAFTPKRKLRVVTIGAGYAGMTLAQKIQHKYEKQMDQYVEHVIYEAKDCVGGTWVANTYPGVMCDVPSAIYVGARAMSCQSSKS